MHCKLLFAPDGKIYGAQIVGLFGVDKRIDTIATAMMCGKTAPELAELELAYAPPFSSAKDPVNFLGMIAQDILDGLTHPAQVEDLSAEVQVVDVRTTSETASGIVPGAVNIPLAQLRSRLHELDRNRVVVTCCQVGLRGYLAERILRQNGFQARNLSGGYQTYRMVKDQPTGQPCACLGPKQE
jgi:rhodanese-related sulfurtransferase